MTSDEVVVGVVCFCAGWWLTVGYFWLIAEPRLRREKEQRELTARVDALERKS